VIFLDCSYCIAKQLSLNLYVLDAPYIPCIKDNFFKNLKTFLLTEFTEVKTIFLKKKFVLIPYSEAENFQYLEI